MTLHRRTSFGLVAEAHRVRVAELLHDAVGGTRPAAASLALVTSLPAVVLCIDDDPVAAAVGSGSAEAWAVRAIAVDPARRGQGLGRHLLDQLSRAVESPWLEAETDADSVGFYRRCGFTTTSLGEKYPGVERFRCRRATSAVPTGSA